MTLVGPVTLGYIYVGQIALSFNSTKIPQLGGSMPSNALPPLVALTPTDHGAIVVVVAYCFAGFTLVAAGARIAITVIHKQGFHRDDVGYFGGAVSIVRMSIRKGSPLTDDPAHVVDCQCSLRTSRQCRPWETAGKPRCVSHSQLLQG